MLRHTVLVEHCETNEHRRSSALGVYANVAIFVIMADRTSAAELHILMRERL